MFTEFVERLVTKLIPDHQLVVVAPGSKLLIFMIPFEATNLLLMTNKLAKPLIRLAHVAMVDGTIPRSRCQDVLVPCKGTNTSSMSHHGTKTTLGLRIPNLDLTSIRAYRDMRTLCCVSVDRAVGLATLTRWIQFTLVTESSPSSHSFVTRPLFEFHMYTQDPRPTPRMF